MKYYKCPGCGRKIACSWEWLPCPGPGVTRYVAYCECRQCGFRTPYGQGNTEEEAENDGNRLAKQCAEEWTEEENEKTLSPNETYIIKSFGASWISRADAPFTDVDLWNKKPTVKNKANGTDGAWIARITYNLFPSINHGDLICVDQNRYFDER